MAAPMSAESNGSVVLSRVTYDGTPDDDHGDCVLTQWKVKVGGGVSVAAPLFMYKTPDNRSIRYRARTGGTVLQLLVDSGATLIKGMELLVLKDCRHTIVMKDMCGECGADLRSEQKVQNHPNCASVSMIHSVPELKVTEEQALILGQADKQRLLREKRLALLVDLDQTLIHTTNDDIDPRLQDIFHFQMWNGYSMRWYHTRVRPGTEDFLKRVSQLYELHICTFGSRYYAHMVACMIDPEKKYFSERILSRDECLDPNLKVANLSALFPCGDDLVCVIDDREDVWNFIPNMIHVKPYSFFRHTGDINSPGSAPGTTVGQNPYDPLHQYENLFRPGVTIQKVKQTKEDESSSELKDIVMDLVEQSATKFESEDEEEKKKVEIPKESSTEGEISEDLKNITVSKEKEDFESSAEEKTVQEDYVLKVIDDDDYLMYLADILEHIHQAYYHIFDQQKTLGIKEIPLMNHVVPYVKRKVLKGCRIVFSAVIPVHAPPKRCRIWQVATNLGAEIQDKVRLPKRKDDNKATTHVIAAKVGTLKVNEARRAPPGMLHIVTPDWLWSCNERWEKVTERLFPLITDVPVKPPKREAGKTQRKPEKIRQIGSAEAPVETEENFPTYDPLTGKRMANLHRLRDKRTTESGESAWGASKDCLDNNHCEPSCSTKKDFVVNPLLSFTAEEIITMDEEVTGTLHAEGAESSSEDEDLDEQTRMLVLGFKRKRNNSAGNVSPAGSHGDYSPNDDSSSSSAETLDNDRPKHYGRLKKRKHDNKMFCLPDDEGGDDSVASDNFPKFPRGTFPKDSDQSEDSRGSSSDFNESVGSFDEEMGLAIEKEFLGM